jgi:hypothetical protein
MALVATALSIAAIGRFAFSSPSVSVTAFANVSAE